MHWPRGKVLGGTSVINYMIHVRGNSHDYDKWEALGNPGWSYKEVLPYFLKMEDSNVKVHDSGYHRTGGYLSIQDIPFRSESSHAFVRAAEGIGYKYVDYNGESQMGVSYIQGTLRNGSRCSAEKSYLRPAKHRSNLKISTKSRAVQVLIDPDTKIAYGVKYIKNRRYRIARASKEVILSAGAFNSPQLLMLSGIGPKKHLEELEIPVLKDLPVGQKLYDHITFLGLMFTVNESIVFQQSSVEDPGNVLKFLFEGVGPLTTLGAVEAIAYIKTNATKYVGNYPDMELLFIGGGLQSDKGKFYRSMFRVNDEVYNKLWKPLENKFAWSVFPMLLHPKSYGYLKLKSKNPWHWPKFYGNYMTDRHNADMKTMIAAIREVQKIAKSPAFQKYGCEQVSTPVPGCESHQYDSDAYWECAIRHITATLHHQIATCKMGPPSDQEAIVDNKLRVYGIKSLRVADTSIIPITLAAHTNTPSYMVGEKAADLIKEEWNENVLNINPKYSPY